MTTVRLYLTKVNLMLKSPLLPRFGDLVVAIVDDVLGQGLTLDRAYARHFSGIELKPQEQARIALVTGDLLRRLSLYCALTGIQVRRPRRTYGRCCTAGTLSTRSPSPTIRPWIASTKRRSVAV